MTISRIRNAVVGGLVLALLSVSPTAAQDNWLAFTYGASTPMGPTKDFAPGTSWRNIGVEYSSFIKRHVAVGFTASWSVFSARVEDVTSSFGGVDITGTQARYVNAFPLLLTGKYFLGGRSSRNKVDGWIGAGAGAMVSENRVEVGTFAVKDTKWHLAIAPEAGIVYSLHRDMALFGQVRYNYAFKTSDIEHQFMNFNVGLAWRN
jgi:hypothetical protein